MNGNIRRLSYIENGKRYAVCTECGNKWNIAKGQIVLSSGYVCPNCEKKGKQRNVQIEISNYFKRQNFYAGL